MSLYRKYMKMTVKDLKNTDIYKSMEGRSKLKTKIEIVEGMCRYLKNFSGDKPYGPFSGIKSLDSIVLSYLSNQDLANLSCTNKYFNQFNLYPPLWKHKILSTFGKDHLVSYTGTDWRCYYYRLHKRVYQDPKPLKYITYRHRYNTRSKK